MRGVWLVMGLGLAAVVGGIMVRQMYIADKVAALSAPPVLAFTRANAALANTPHLARLVIAGDSRIARWSPVPSAPHVDVVMRGIGGETSGQLAQRFDTDVLALAPRAVLVATGGNDLVASMYVDDARRERIADDVVARIVSMAERTAAAGASFYVLTVPPPARPDLLRRLVWDDVIYAAFARLNRRLSAQAGQSLVVLDHCLPVSADGVLDAAFAADTLHFTSDAYRCWNAVVERVFADLSPQGGDLSVRPTASACSCPS